MRADARRNREQLLAAAARLLAERGRGVSMEEIAAEAGLGLGTLYRNFDSKQALLTEILRARYQALVALAAEVEQQVEQEADPRAAFRAVLVGYLEHAEGDAAFQHAMLGEELVWDGVEGQKAEFAERVGRIIASGVAAGVLRADLRFADFPMLTCGLMSTMYFRPGEGADWRRHLELVLAGIETDAAWPSR